MGNYAWCSPEKEDTLETAAPYAEVPPLKPTVAVGALETPRDSCVGMGVTNTTMHGQVRALHPHVSHHAITS